MDAIPAAKDSDADDVALALTAAHALWRRGAYAEAVGCIERAAEAARAAHDEARARDLFAEAARLAQAGGDAPIERRAASKPLSAPPTAPSALTPTVPAFAAVSLSSPPSRAPVSGETIELSDDDLEVIQSTPVPVPGPGPALFVPPAEMVHAGLHDPWAEEAVEALEFPDRMQDASDETASLLRSEAVFAQLRDDDRERLWALSERRQLCDGEEASKFALAWVISGRVDVAATMVDAAAAHLHQGCVVYARGSLPREMGVPMRLVASQKAELALWPEAIADEVAAILGRCPAAHLSLQSASDRLQATVGATIGPLGERLDASIRNPFLAKLAVRVLAPHEILVHAGEPLPGLALVTSGELVIASGEAVLDTVNFGEVLYPAEILGRGVAPATARAGEHGALLLFGSRSVAQELLVSCPPLLDVIVAMDL